MKLEITRKKLPIASDPLYLITLLLDELSIISHCRLVLIFIKNIWEISSYIFRMLIIITNDKIRRTKNA